MKTKYLTLSLAIVAGLLCFGAFARQIIRSQTPDYTILLAGIFIVGLGIAAWFRKK